MTADLLWRALVTSGVTHVVGLPDTMTGPIFARNSQSRPSHDVPGVINVCREGEAYGIAAGLWAGGAWPVVLIQSTGLFESGDALRSFALELEAPLDLLIGWRGRLGKLNAGTPDTARDLLEPTLAAWRIPYDSLADPSVPTREPNEPDTEQQLAAWLKSGRPRERGVRACLIPQ